MNPIIEKLLVLQDRDLHLNQLLAEQQRLPAEQEELERQLKQAEANAETAKTDAHRVETDRKKLEIDAESKRTLVRKYKNQLLEIKNNDQFHALQHEITMAESEIRKTEDHELELMEQYEQAQINAREGRARLDEVTRRIEEQRRYLAEKSASIEKQIKGLEEERSKLAVVIDETILERYGRIARSKHGQAVVRISHGMCAGCHLKLTVQEIHDAHHDAELITCTNCGRILYWMAE